MRFAGVPLQRRPRSRLRKAERVARVGTPPLFARVSRPALAGRRNAREQQRGVPSAGETLRAADSAQRCERDANEPHARLAMIDITAGSIDWSQMEDRLEALRASARLHVLGSLTSFLQAAGRTSSPAVYNEQAATASVATGAPVMDRRAGQGSAKS